MKRLQINILLVEPLEQMSHYMKFLKDIIAKKRKLLEYEIVVLTKCYN